MILDKIELNLLCKIQDIQRLPGLPLFIILTQQESNEAKQSLIEKGIMINGRAINLECISLRY